MLLYPLLQHIEDYLGGLARVDGRPWQLSPTAAGTADGLDDDDDAGADPRRDDNVGLDDGTLTSLLPSSSNACSMLHPMYIHRWIVMQKQRVKPYEQQL